MSLNDMIAPGERLTDMATLWYGATVEEWREMVMLILEGVVEYVEAIGTIVTHKWQDRGLDPEKWFSVIFWAKISSTEFWKTLICYGSG